MLATLLQIATLLQDGATTDDDLAAAIVNVVNSRFLNGSAIPKQVCHWFHTGVCLAHTAH